MLRTNLSTRPFYNERAVRVVLGVLVLLTAALTAFNAAELLTLNSRNSEFVGRAEASEAKAAELREQARQTQQSLNRAEVEAVQAAAREANMLIERRAFSWTDLFNRFEETLPPDVRIVAVTPQMDNQGRMLVAVTIISRKAGDFETFIDRLQATGAFAGVISRHDETMEDGSMRSVLQGYYKQSQRPDAAVSSPPASDSTGGEGNRSPANVTSPAPSTGEGR
jgi:hypothetical protein